MKGFFKYIFFYLVLTPSIFGQDSISKKVENRSSSQMTFIETTHDFGEIAYSDSTVWIFEFENTGKEPLIISSAQSSCGCTTPMWTREPVKKGKKGFIKVQYNSKIIGPFQKNITINSNASNTPVVLTIKGKVKEKAANLQ